MEKTVKAYAKLNITLDVVGRQPDGYHDMRMIMQSVELCDDITIRLTKGGRIRVKTNLHYLPSGGGNIAAKAARLFFQQQSILDTGADIKIYKRIPVCAGMAGGSSDAAAVLRGLNEMLDTGLNSKELERMAEQLGSDVPYCVAGGTVLAEGRGEKLTNLRPLPPCHVVICKPGFSVSTPELFSRLDWRSIRNRPDTLGVIKALEAQELASVARRMYNVFEDVPMRGRKEIVAIKETMLDCGALGAVMSGTGPAVFGLFENHDGAKRAASRLRRSVKEVFLTENIERLNV